MRSGTDEKLKRAAELLSDAWMDQYGDTGSADQPQTSAEKIRRQLAEEANILKKRRQRRRIKYCAAAAGFLIVIGLAFMLSGHNGSSIFAPRESEADIRIDRFGLYLRWIPDEAEVLNLNDDDPDEANYAIVSNEATMFLKISEIKEMPGDPSAEPLPSGSQEGRQTEWFFVNDHSVKAESDGGYPYHDYSWIDTEHSLSFRLYSNAQSSMDLQLIEGIQF